MDDKKTTTAEERKLKTAASMPVLLVAGPAATARADRERTSDDAKPVARTTSSCQMGERQHPATADRQTSSEN